MLRVSEVADVGIQKISVPSFVSCDIEGCNQNSTYRVIDNTDREWPAWTRLLCEEHTKKHYGPAYNGTTKA